MISQEQETAMYDQPDDQLAWGDDDPEAQPSKKHKKVDKKHKKKVRSLRDMAYETMSPSNVIMRDEMARGVHQPERIGKIVDDLLGRQSEVSDIALQVIEETELSLELRLHMSQWIVIQALVEAGIRKGYRLGAEHAASGRG